LALLCFRSLLRRLRAEFDICDPTTLIVSDRSLRSRSQRRRSLERGAEGAIAAEGIAAVDVCAVDMVMRDMAAEDSSEGGIAVNGDTNKLTKVDQPITRHDG